MLMRRGHRLHSLHGAEPDMAGLARLPSVHRFAMAYNHLDDHTHLTLMTTFMLYAALFVPMLVE